jgi:hypothetical protein
MMHGPINLRFLRKYGKCACKTEGMGLLNTGTASYNSVQNNFSSCFLSINMKINIHKIIIVSVDLYGYETWSHTVRKERRLRVFENRVLRETERSGIKRDEEWGQWRKKYCVSRSFMIWISDKILFAW